MRGVRIPDFIVPVYPAAFVEEIPSPARLLSSLDPLLSFSVRIISFFPCFQSSRFFSLSFSFFSCLFLIDFLRCWVCVWINTPNPTTQGQNLFSLWFLFFSLCIWSGECWCPFVAIRHYLLIGRHRNSFANSLLHTSSSGVDSISFFFLFPNRSSLLFISLSIHFFRFSSKGKWIPYWMTPCLLCEGSQGVRRMYFSASFQICRTVS